MITPDFLALLATAFLVGMASGIGLVLLVGLEEKSESLPDSVYVEEINQDD